jgi:hypothetical protein
MTPTEARSETLAESASSWPELPWDVWQPTISTLHLWVQMVGKVRMALAPPLNHWWHVPLYVTPRGLTNGGAEAPPRGQGSPSPRPASA